MAAPSHIQATWGRDKAMGFWDDLWRGRSTDFDSGSAATNSIELTKRNHTVSLTKQGAATGNLRINLSWRMRTSDIGGGQQRGSLLRHPFKTFKPDVVQAHTQSMVNVDLDLGVMYELADGSKGVVQPWATSSATSTTRRT